MYWDGDTMNTFAFFKNIFDRAFILLSQPISLGLGVSVSLFQMFVALSLLSLMIVVIRRLYD